jgi:hypothetical protein
MTRGPVSRGLRRRGDLPCRLTLVEGQIAMALGDAQSTTMSFHIAPRGQINRSDIGLPDFGASHAPVQTLLAAPV